MHIYTRVCRYIHIQNNPHYAWYYSVPEEAAVKVEGRWGKTEQQLKLGSCGQMYM